jgi:hypothetical protein
MVTMRKILTLIILFASFNSFAIKEFKHLQPETKNAQFGIQVPKNEFIFEMDTLRLVHKFYICDTLMQATDSMATLFRNGKYETVNFGITSLSGARVHWMSSSVTILLNRSFISILLIQDQIRGIIPAISSRISMNY